MLLQIEIYDHMHLSQNQPDVFSHYFRCILLRAFSSSLTAFMRSMRARSCSLCSRAALTAVHNNSKDTYVCGIHTVSIRLCCIEKVNCATPQNLKRRYPSIQYRYAFMKAFAMYDRKVSSIRTCMVTVACQQRANHLAVHCSAVLCVPALPSD